MSNIYALHPHIHYSTPPHMLEQNRRLVWDALEKETELAKEKTDAASDILKRVERLGDDPLAEDLKRQAQRLHSSADEHLGRWFILMGRLQCK